MAEPVLDELRLKMDGGNAIEPITYRHDVALDGGTAQTIDVPEVSGIKAAKVFFSATQDFYAAYIYDGDPADLVVNGNFTDYVTNGAFGSDTGWTKGNDWSITGGKAVIAGAQTAASALSQSAAATLLEGFTYKLTFTTTLSEHVTNGAFGSDTGWTKGTGWTIAAGVASCDGSQTDTSLLEQDSAITLVEGRSYTVTYTITRSAGTITPVLGEENGTTRNSANTFSETIVAGATQKITFSADEDFVGTVDNVLVTAQGNITPSIGGTAGTARSTANTFSENIVAGSTQAIAFTADENFVGTLDNVSLYAWQLGTGWTIASGVATSDASQSADSDLSQTNIDSVGVVEGQAYRVTFTVSSYSAGNVTPVIGGTEGTDRAANGTFTETIIAGSTQAIALRADLNFAGSVDSFSAVPIATVPSATNTTGAGMDLNPGPRGLAGISQISLISPYDCNVNCQFVR